MAKLIYVDENGNEHLVSGTINNAQMLPIDATENTSTKDYIDSKIRSFDKIGSFLLGKVGDNKTGNINLSESIENARGLIFSISLASDTAPVRSTVFAPIYALTNYGIMQDYTIGNDRNYWNINKVNNTTLSVTNTSISSGSNFYVTVWIVR